MPADTKATVWIVSLLAGPIYEARLFLVEKTGLDSTDVVLRSNLQSTLLSMAPKGIKRIPKFPGQGAAVVENWF